ncbi:MAG: sodium:solute symporter family protein [Chitinophagales bacterium]
MTLDLIDWIIIVVYFIITTYIGLRFSKQAGKDTAGFFLGGRNLPWYLAGTSMVATTFAADTPLAVTELVSKNGIAGNWLWWSFLFGGMLTVFFFSRLWRRANIMTEVELIELRYSGRPAAFLRGFKGLYLGLFMNTLVIGWVNLAMISILKVFFGISSQEALMYAALMMILTAIYSSISGLLGVAVTDAFQFVVAMTGCIVLAILVLHSDRIGGITGLKEKLPGWSLDFFPEVKGHSYTGNVATTLTISIGAFLAYVGVQWWASWYPGAEPGGGGYIAQRMMSTKNEKHSIYATLFFQIAHYCLRPWPWIIVGLCSMVLYPELSMNDKKEGFVMAMKDFLPTGMKGFLLVAFFAAYMSTLATQLNWGASYLLNDVYKRFIRKPSVFNEEKAGERHYVAVSRIITILLMIVSLAVTTQMQTISGVWSFLIECGAGLGLVLILRWYWWRINAWSEITATIAPFAGYAFSRYVLKWEFPDSFFVTVGFTTVCWLVATFITAPVEEEKLKEFYRRIHPGGWWEPVRALTGMEKSTQQMGKLVVCWLSAVIMTYSILFLTGSLIFQEWIDAAIYAGIALGSWLLLRSFITRTKIFMD